MAPFVELEWGEKAYGLMRRVKALLDPQALLNPGVILNDDPRAHLQALKPLPRAHPIVDRCIECGFCEPRCPSRDLTTTPRQRIVVQREIARLRVTAESPSGFAGSSRTTWAWASRPAPPTGCARPRARSGSTPARTRSGSERRSTPTTAGRRRRPRSTSRWSAPSRAPRSRVADAAHAVLGSRRMGAVARGMRAATAGEAAALERGDAAPHQPAPHRHAHRRGSARVVYFPSCIVRTMGPARGDDAPAVHAALLSLLAKARCDVVFPDGMAELCCGMPFESKGFPAQAEEKARELDAALLAASEGGALPSSSTRAPAAYRMQKLVAARLAILDQVEFIDYLLASARARAAPGPDRAPRPVQRDEGRAQRDVPARRLGMRRAGGRPERRRLLRVRRATAGSRTPS